MTYHDRLVIPGLSDAEQDSLDVLRAQLSAHSDRNLLRQSYYEMRHLSRNVAVGIVPPQYNRLGLVLGWTSKAVDALTRRCNLDAFIWPDGDLGDLGYGEFRDDNHLDATIKAATAASARLGVSFLVNTVGAAGEPSSLLHFKDALNATGKWNNRTRALDSALSINEWNEERPTEPSAFTLYLYGRTITVERDGSGWDVDKQDHPWGMPVEPVVHEPFSRELGVSRITRPMMSLQDRAVAALTRMEAHMDIYAIPDFWLLGADMSLFKNSDGSQKAAWEVMMGRIKGVPDMEPETGEDRHSNDRADVKHFPASSPEPHLKAINAFAKLFAREADLPDSSLAIADVANAPSAESMVESRESMISAAESATTGWSLPLRRSLVRGLAIRNGLDVVPAEWRSIDAKWRPPMYLSKASQADAGAKQLASGPEWLRETEVGLELLGLSEQQIQRALAERRRLEGRTGVLDRLRAAAAEAESAEGEAAVAEEALADGAAG